MGTLSKNLNSFFRRRSVKYGLPFLLVVLGGSFGLREFTQLRYQFSNVSRVKREEIKEQGVEMKNPEEVTLETEFDKIKNMDIDNWEQVRGPRPWEENETK